VTSETESVFGLVKFYREREGWKLKGVRTVFDCNGNGIKPCMMTHIYDEEKRLQGVPWHGERKGKKAVACYLCDWHH
jgi:hypothetical protein